MRARAHARAHTHAHTRTHNIMGMLYTRAHAHSHAHARTQNIIGMLYTKDLILVDPDDELETRTLVSFQGRAMTHFILDITPLHEARARARASGAMRGVL